jgi:hypothetical protein
MNEDQDNAPAKGKVPLDLWTPKVRLTPRRKIATFGTEFAAQLGPKLTEAGYKWLNMEPAPKGLSAVNAGRFNYDVLSCRLGPVSSVAQFHQWVSWALGKSSPPDEIWQRDGRFFDPFRPTIEPDGFVSPAEALASRKTALEALEKTLQQAGLLVLTFGSIESWVHKRLGWEYGEWPVGFSEMFDPEQHETKARAYLAVVKVLKDMLGLLQEANPNLRVLLGVSGALLGMRYSDSHLAVASAGSAAVLRAAIGQVASTQKGVEYLPTFEMQGFVQATGNPRKDMAPVTQAFFEALKGDGAEKPTRKRRKRANKS